MYCQLIVEGDKEPHIQTDFTEILLKERGRTKAQKKHARILSLRHKNQNKRRCRIRNDKPDKVPDRNHTNFVLRGERGEYYNGGAL